MRYIELVLVVDSEFVEHLDKNFRNNIPEVRKKVYEYCKQLVDQVNLVNYIKQCFQENLF